MGSAVNEPEYLLMPNRMSHTAQAAIGISRISNNCRIF